MGVKIMFHVIFFLMSQASQSNTVIKSVKSIIGFLIRRPAQILKVISMESLDYSPLHHISYSLIITKTFPIAAQYEKFVKNKKSSEISGKAEEEKMMIDG